MKSQHPACDVCLLTPLVFSMMPLLSTAGYAPSTQPVPPLSTGLAGEGEEQEEPLFGQRLNQERARGGGLISFKQTFLPFCFGLIFAPASRDTWFCQFLRIERNSMGSKYGCCCSC